MFKVNNSYTRTYSTSCSSVCIVNFEQVNAGWVLGKKSNMNSFLILDVLLFQCFTSKICEILFEAEVF